MKVLVEHGWSRVDQNGDLQLSIDWFNVYIGPQVVLEFLSCSCKRDCVTPSCQCVANNLAYNDLCHARQCKNQKNDFADEKQSSDEHSNEEFD